MIVKNKMKGINTNKKEILGKFDMNGLSSKINIFKFYYQEVKIRYNNGQNFSFLVILFIIKILNFLKNKILKIIFFK